MTEKPEKVSRVLLIVDDRDEVRLALARYFALHFTEIVSASKADEAEELLRSSSCCVITTWALKSRRRSCSFRAGAPSTSASSE